MEQNVKAIKNNNGERDRGRGFCLME